MGRKVKWVVWDTGNITVKFSTTLVTNNMLYNPITRTYIPISELKRLRVIRFV